VNIAVTEERHANLDDYAQIPMSLEVHEILDATAVKDDPLGFKLSKRAIQVPYIKDYDAVESPRDWPKSFDLTHWGFLVARSNEVRIGGAAVAFDTPGLVMLEERRDLAVLWDIRVSPEVRGKGVGTALFKAAEQWAITKGCRQLKVETQNINVPACRFYEKQGCALGTIRQNAYREFPDEIQMLWYKELA
jgi:ribosomal protein S18 acetylase RimI-like enzyme